MLTTFIYFNGIILAGDFEDASGLFSWGGLAGRNLNGLFLVTPPHAAAVGRTLPMLGGWSLGREALWFLDGAD